MTDDRSERLRKRRKQSTESITPERNDTDDSSPAASRDKSADQAVEERDENGSSESDVERQPAIKEEQVGTYMYLPESQTKELRRLYNVLKAEYEFEYDTEFEKNRHFYPLIIQYGLENLDGLDASEIRDRLEEIT